MRRSLWRSAAFLLAVALGHPLAASPRSPGTPARTPVLAPARKAPVPTPQPARPRPTLALQVGHSAYIYCLAFSPDGKLLATGSYDTTARVWDARNGKLKATLTGAGPVEALAFSPDGRTLAIGGRSAADGTHLWDVGSNKLVATLQGHTAGVTCLAFSPDGRVLATGSRDRTVRLWDVLGAAGLQSPRATFSDQASGVLALAFAPDGRTLATTSREGTARLWDLPSRQLRATLLGHTGVIGALAFSPDGRTLATGGDDGTARLWEVASGRLQWALTRHTSWITAVAFSPDGRTLATASADKTARLWNPSTGQPQGLLEGHTRWVGALAFSPDGSRLATGSQDRTARIWDARTGRLLATLPGNSNEVVCLAFSPDAQTLATGSDDGSARLWNTRSGQIQAILHRITGAVSTDQSLFSPDGRTLVIRPYNPTVQLWDARTGQLRTILPTPGGATARAFSPDGKTLATSGGRTPTLWDVESGRLKAILEGHTSTVNGFAFSPDGKTLATGSADTTVRLWDVVTGRQQTVLQGHTNEIVRLTFSPDGKTLATMGDKRSLPSHWGGNTSFALDPTQAHRGAFSVRLYPKEQAQTGLLQWIAAGDLLGKRLRLAGYLKTEKVSEGYAALAMTVRGPGDTTLEGADTVDHGVQGSTDWTRHEITLSVPPGAARIGFGVFVEGKGAVWADDFTLEVVGGNEPDGASLRGSDGPKNLDFEEGRPDLTMRLWDVASGQLKAVVPNTANAPTFSPDGQIVATGSTDRSVHLCSAASGQIQTVLAGHTAVVWALAFSPDGRVLASGSADGSVRLWQMGSGQLQVELRGHTAEVARLVFSPDGNTLVSAGMDHTLRLWDVVSERPRAVLPQTASIVPQLFFSADSRTLAAKVLNGQVLFWDVATGSPIVPPASAMAGFAPSIRRPYFTAAGAALSLHDPRDGRVMATFLSIPQAAAEAAVMRPIELGGKPIELGGKPVAAPDSGEWFVTTPEGYFDGSANAARFIYWNVNGSLFPAERYFRRFHRPDLVQKALRGERLTAPAMSANDVPPAARFVRLKDGADVEGDHARVTVEVQGLHTPKEVELLVNGRPLPPESARPIELGGKPIELGGKPIELGGKPLDPSYRLARQFTFNIPLPKGAPEVHVRAVAYDEADLGSDPVEVVLRNAAAKPVPGRLYVLAVGVSRYKNAQAQRFPDLRYPAADAQAIAARFQRESKPLYEDVQVRALLDQEATAANVRAELRRLQQKVRPGQIDTVVVFLSGHGISQEGRYYFATHDFDRNKIAASSLSGAELRQALGGKLSAKAVFLFLDTCHSGGLGGRNEDLALEVGESAYVMASSGAQESSYESKEWGHGAFTFALLRALEQGERDGLVRFNGLAYLVPNEVAGLMAAAGRCESEQRPCIPFGGRDLRMPIAQAGR